MRIAALLVFLSVAFGPISARADDVATGTEYHPRPGAGIRP